MTGDAPDIGLDKYYADLWEIKSTSHQEMINCENILHTCLDEFRQKRGNNWTEWFKIDLERVQSIVKNLPFFIRSVSILNIEEIHSNALCGKVEEIKLIYTRRNYQSIIIKKSVIHFQQNDKGMLVLTCGIGKTLISLWITQELKSNTILISVPNKLLLKQWKEVIGVLFQNTNYLIVSSGIEIENIIQFLKDNEKNCVVITTYASAHKVYNATQLIKFVFGMKILDEVHHLTSFNMQLAHNTKTYIQMLNIPSLNELTEKLSLKTVKRTALTTTYDKARKIIADKNIKSKESYYELYERDTRLDKEPEIVFKGRFTNWIEYLSIQK